MELESENQTFILFNILENYGWYLLISIIFLIYIGKLLKPKINKVYEWKSEQDYIAKYHKDPDLFIEKFETQRKRLEQLQEKYQNDAVIYQEKLKEREAKKLQEIAEKYEKIEVGTKLGSSSKDESSKSLKPEYNPLMGGSSRSYRPTRKSPCSGGGCGG